MTMMITEKNLNFVAVKIQNICYNKDYEIHIHSIATFSPLLSTHVFSVVCKLSVLELPNTGSSNSNNGK